MGENLILDKKWYVVHTYSGYEAAAKTSLQDRIKTLKMEDHFGEILIPVEKVVEKIKGKEKVGSRKFFPGYILVHMVLNNETWHVVRSTPKVTGFVGNNTNPPAMPDKEVDRITNQIFQGALKPKPKVSFEHGETIKVTEGPFANFHGTIEEVREEKQKLKVQIRIFGRETPLELDFNQVEKVV